MLFRSVGSLSGHGNRVSCLGVSNDGISLCTGSWDSLVSVFHPAFILITVKTYLTHFLLSLFFFFSRYSSRCGPGNGNLFNEDTKQQTVLRAPRCRIEFPFAPCLDCSQQFDLKATFFNCTIIHIICGYLSALENLPNSSFFHTFPWLLPNQPIFEISRSISLSFDIMSI